jgi:hypothetical protein
LIKNKEDDFIVQLETQVIDKTGISERRNLLYGISGIVMSITGFLVWIWSFMEKTEDHIMMLLSFGRMFGISPLQYLPDSIIGMVVIKALLIGLTSTLSILFSLWAFGYWKGENKLSIHAFISDIGKAHFYIGIGFLIASTTILIDWKLSIGVLLLNLLVGMLLLFVTSSNIFSMPLHRIFSFVSLSFSAYFILFVLTVFLII